MTLRVVFDSNVVLSALLFPAGGLAWMRAHWVSRVVQALASKDTVDELIAALAYRKFGLVPAEITAVLGDVLPGVEIVDVPRVTGGPRCRDAGDQKFVDLAIAGHADMLVTGDRDLLALKATVSFAVESPAAYARRFDEAGRIEEVRAKHAARRDTGSRLSPG